MQKTKSPTMWSAWGDSNPGRMRQNNEDRILCDSDRGIFVVADGMGGEAAGEVAAQQAIDAIKKRLSEETGSAARRLREAIAGANNEIYRLAERNPKWKGMACVLTAAMVEDGTLHVGHVGDSRLYKIRESGISKITTDHSPVGQKEDSGELTELEAMRHPRRNEVFRDVGSQLHKPDDPDFIEYLQVPFEKNTAYVICSDGLSDMLTSKEILGAVLENAGKPQDTVRRLIEQSNAAGGKDNISAIVIESDDFAVGPAKLRIRERVAGGLIPFNLKILLGRWAFLIYGLAAGLLISYFWIGAQETEIAQPDTQSGPSPQVLHVKPGSADYSTIGSALEAARPGDRIEIGNGEYEEAVRLKEGVDVTATSPGMAVLHISRALPNTDAAVTADGIKRASLSGLTIKADPGAALPFGIRISNSNLNVTNVEVSGATGAGITIDGSSGSILASAYVHGNVGPGILVGGTATPLMIGNLIYANGISRAHTYPGLYVTGNSNPEVKRNIFSGNGAEAIRLQRQELKDRMSDNLFVNSGRTQKVVVERGRQ